MATYYSNSRTYDSDLNSNYSSWDEGAAKPTADHAITIVGWDDTKETQDSENPGAYLVMNSWGTAWGDEGLFWIAYNDASLLNPAVFIMEENAPGTLPDTDVFSHTETGWTGSSTLRSATKAIHSMNTSESATRSTLARIEISLHLSMVWEAYISIIFMMGKA
jgi:C1A family cysteine protease